MVLKMDQEKQVDNVAGKRVERRKNVRVVPDAATPVFAYIDEEECVIADVSVGGMAFRTQTADCNISLPESGYYFHAEILLPRETKPFMVTMEVLGQGVAGIVRCAIREITDEDHQILDNYVTDRLEDVFADYLG